MFNGVPTPKPILIKSHELSRGKETNEEIGRTKYIGSELRDKGYSWELNEEGCVLLYCVFSWFFYFQEQLK